MLLSSSSLLLALLVPLYHASPAPAAVDDVYFARPHTDLIVRNGQHLDKRISTDFSLDQTLENQVLFDGNSAILGVLPVDAPPVTVVCTKCCTTGEITASLTDDTVVDPTLRFDLKGVSAFVELDVVANGASSFSIPLFQSPPGPLGFSIPSGPSLGLTFQIDLVFNVAANLDVSGGFFVQLPDDAFFEASLLDGAMTNVSLDGIMSKSLPITVHNDNSSLTFQVDLQLKAQVGIDTSGSILPVFDSFGIGAVVGVFVNLLEFIAKVETTDQCQLQSSETFDVNVGAFLNADIQLGDDKTFGAVPTVSTTLFEAAIGTQCLVTSGLAVPTRASSLVTAPSCLVTTLTSTLPSQTASTDCGDSSTTTLATSPNGFITPSYTPAPSTSANSYNRRTPKNETNPVATSTVFSTTTLTITACASAVANCPGSLQSVIEITQTVCPSSSSASSGLCSAVTDATPLSSLSAPATQTFTPGNATVSSATTTTPVGTATSTIMSTISLLPTESAGGGGFLHVNGTTTGLAPTGTGVVTATPSGSGIVTVSAADGGYPSIRGTCYGVMAGLAFFVFVAL